MLEDIFSPTCRTARSKLEILCEKILIHALGFKCFPCLFRELGHAFVVFSVIVCII